MDATKRLGMVVQDHAGTAQDVEKILVHQYRLYYAGIQRKVYEKKG